MHSLPRHNIQNIYIYSQGDVPKPLQIKIASSYRYVLSPPYTKDKITLDNV